mgnify:CR=1 FL=1
MNSSASGNHSESPLGQLKENLLAKLSKVQVAEEASHLLDQDQLQAKNRVQVEAFERHLMRRQGIDVAETPKSQITVCDDVTNNYQSSNGWGKGALIGAALATGMGGAALGLGLLDHVLNRQPPAVVQPGRPVDVDRRYNLDGEFLP